MTKQPEIRFLIKRSLLFIGVILGLTFLLDILGNNLIGSVLKGWPTDSVLAGLGFTVACFFLGTVFTRESQLTLTQFNYSRRTQFNLIILALVSTILLLSIFKVSYSILANEFDLVKIPRLTHFVPNPVLNILVNVGAQFVISLLVVFLGWLYVLLKQFFHTKWLPLMFTIGVAVSPVLLLLATIILPVEQRIRLIDFAKQPVVLLLIQSLGLLILGSINRQLVKKSAYD